MQLAGIMAVVAVILAILVFGHVPWMRLVVLIFFLFTWYLVFWSSFGQICDEENSEQRASGLQPERINHGRIE